MSNVPSSSALRSMSGAELDAVFARDVPLATPRGIYRGRALSRIDHETSRRPLWRWSERVGFEWTPWGIDFDRRLWFFFAPRLAIGRFEPRAGPSRWRDTDALGLHYQGSRLPRFVKGALYDEVKPLSDRLALGIGGMNAGRGIGDHFYFALERVE